MKPPQQPLLVAIERRQWKTEEIFPITQRVYILLVGWVQTRSFGRTWLKRGPAHLQAPSHLGERKAGEGDSYSAEPQSVEAGRVSSSLGKAKDIFLSSCQGLYHSSQ